MANILTNVQGIVPRLCPRSSLCFQNSCAKEWRRILLVFMTEFFSFD